MPRQQLEVAVCALQRSGHHAVMSWLQSLFEKKYGEALYINWVNQFSKSNLDPFNTKTAPTVDSNKCTPDQREQKRDVLLYNFEDTGVHSLVSMMLHSEAYNGVSDRRVSILIVRDFYNLVASRMHRTRKGDPFDYNYNALSGLWVDHMSEYNASAIEKPTSILPINYNEWFSSKTAREAICDVLECEYSEDTMDSVNVAGDGSSFTGTAGSGRDLNVLKRWEAFRKDPEFISVVSHEVIRHFSRLCFGWHLELQDGTLVSVDSQ